MARITLAFALAPILLATGLLAAAPSFGQTPAPGPAAAAPGAPIPKAPSDKQAAQQELMKTCNATATDRHFAGDARKSFMSACLSGKQTPQVMMKVCNSEATQEKMTPDARKTYVATCLKS
jgi:psiF repeat